MSLGTRMHERFARRLWARRVSALIYLASAVAYLAWRTTIINPDAIVLSSVYYLSDLIAVVLGATTVFVSWHHRHRRSLPAPANLTVDVFIPTYREPLDMVRRTLEAAIAIRYPHETFLLDDGNRPAMRALAAELRCHYLTRPDNAGAKAGNLNHAISRSEGEFIAVFDADHIPQTHALDVTLGLFGDPRVAMVQTPQDYYNTDALQYMNPRRRGGLWHDQSFFYNLSQPGRDHYNAASCAGTSVVYRRSALAEIGGIPTETVTEDVHTSLRLQKAGYSVPYLNEPIAYGVAAADLPDYYRTRLRYGHGNIHALRHENILFSRGLTIRQRFSYLFLGLIYLEGWQQLMVFLVPAAALIFGIAPFQITILNVLIVLLYPLWSYLLMQEVGCGFSRYWTAEVFSMMRFPVHLLASAAVFRNGVAWRSSQKNVKGRLAFRLLLPQIAVLILSAIAIGVGFYRLEGNYTPGPLLAALVNRLPDARSFEVAWSDVTGLLAAAEREVASLVSPAEKPATVTAANQTTKASPAKPQSLSGGLALPGAESAMPPRPVAAPIDWNEPLTRGYTIDLVLIAGFWALFNALRVIFVLGKIVRNARLTQSDYLFRTIVPIQIATEDGLRYVVAKRLSTTRAVVTGALGGLSEDNIANGLLAVAFLPTGAVPVILRAADNWISLPHSRDGVFDIEYPSDVARKSLEAGLYTTPWHRECNNGDAEFATPLGTLHRLFGGPATGPAPWQAGLVLPDGGGEPLPALVRRGEELLMLAAEPSRHDAVRVVVIDRDGWIMRQLLLNRLVGTHPLHSAAAEPRKMFRYQTKIADPVNVAVLQPRRAAIPFGSRWANTGRRRKRVNLARSSESL